MRRLLDADGGVIRTFELDDNEPGGGTIGIRTQQDVTAIIDRNKEMANDPPPVLMKGDRFLYPIASIPLGILDQWAAEDGVHYWRLPREEQAAYLRKKLNDPDWQHLKRTPITI